MIGWIWKGAKLLAKFTKGVAWWAYTKPVLATAIGLTTYTLTQALQARAEEVGYVPVVTEIGRVFGFIATVFHYAVASGLAAAAVVSVGHTGVEAVGSTAGKVVHHMLKLIYNPTYQPEGGMAILSGKTP